MVTITGTNKIKGALDLSGINRQLKAGDVIPLTDEDFSDVTVQIAVNMGFITYESKNNYSGSSSAIKLRNIYDRSIRINALGDEVRSGQTFTLTENQVNSADIRGALAKGMLEIVSSARVAQDMNESDVKVGTIFKDEPETPSNVTETPDDDDSQSPKYLETNEEISESGVINTENPKPVEKYDVPDPKKKSVVWNPTHDPVAHTTKKQMQAISANRTGTSDVVESNVDISEIDFVDHKLDQDRKESHPVLKDKPDAIDDEIDFL